MINNENLLDNNGNPLTQVIDEVGFRHIEDPKRKKNWYKTESARDYITGKSDDVLSGKGARSLERAAKHYQHLREDFSKHQYSPKVMSRKYDKFNGCFSLLFSSLTSALIILFSFKSIEPKSHKIKQVINWIINIKMLLFQEYRRGRIWRELDFMLQWLLRDHL